MKENIMNYDDENIKNEIYGNGNNGNDLYYLL